MKTKIKQRKSNKKGKKLKNLTLRTTIIRQKISKKTIKKTFEVYPFVDDGVLTQTRLTEQMLLRQKDKELRMELEKLTKRKMEKGKRRIRKKEKD